MAKKVTTKKVRICAPCMVDRKPRAVGEVLELGIDEANMLIGSLRAKAAPEDAEVGKPDSAEADKAAAQKAEKKGE